LSRVLIVLHQEHSTPGRVGRLIRERGFDLDIRRPPLGDVLPDHMHDHAGAVIFGGPMSANDSDDWVRRETDWIGRVLLADKPFLGLCLGAQMLSNHLGGRVAPHPEGQVEIGYYPLQPTESGKSFSAETGAHWPEHVYQWHREGFETPVCAVTLAQGTTFENQAFRYGEKAFGLQFHPEVTYAMMCRWTMRAHERMQMPGARMRHEHLAGWFQHDRDVHRWLNAFLDHWIGRAEAA
jgi:GMP synthase (glutamine-hydrolysing)